MHPTSCGGDGQRACCASTFEVPLGKACNDGKVEVPGCSGDCFCGGPTATGQISSRSCTEPVLNSDGSFKSLKTISEPETGWTQPNEGPACRMRGYADMHLHMFAEMAHGGGVLA